MAFLSWLMSQGYSLNTIAREMVQLGDQGTLAQLYANLASDNAANAWPQFQAAVNALGQAACPPAALDRRNGRQSLRLDPV